MSRKQVLILMVLLAAMVCLSSCEEKETPAGVALAVVSGHHANAPVPALNSATVKDAILKSTASYGSVCVIVNDGAPCVAADYNIDPPTQNLSDTKREEIARAQANQIISVLSSAQAVTPEVDTLTAITLAARSLEGAEGEKYSIVMDSGLSTSGYMDFTQNLLRADSQTVVEYLKQTKALPDLSGISVIWVGIGDVTGAQQPLTPSALETLKNLWSEVLYAAGADSVTFSADLPGAAAEEELPYVTPVEIMQDEPINVDVSAITLDTPIVLDEEKILFLPDSAEFADYDAAADTLRPIVEHMAVYPELELVLAGTTATVGSNENCKTFSQRRAEAVKALLMDMGVEEKRIVGTIGLGYDHKYHIPDIGSDGLLNANARANRSVIIFDAASQAAIELL